MKPDHFFTNIAIHAGLGDIKTVKDVYYGMIRTMSRELRINKSVKLPDWGEFKLKTHGARKFFNVSNGETAYLPPKPVVKFSPDHKVKKYFQALGDDRTVLE